MQAHDGRLVLSGTAASEEAEEMEVLVEKDATMDVSGAMARILLSATPVRWLPVLQKPTVVASHSTLAKYFRRFSFAKALKTPRRRRKKVLLPGLRLKRSQNCRWEDGRHQSCKCGNF